MSAFRIHRPQCVFIHIPKTGGMSIRRGVFGGHYDGPEYERLPDDWRGIFTFAFVRHPLDRLCSAFRMFTRRPTPSAPMRSPDLSFDEFWRYASDETICHLNRKPKTPESIRHHTIPQTHPANMLDKAEFVGRFERFSDDWVKIAERLGVMKPLPHWNGTTNKHWSDTIPAELLPEIVAWYAADFDQLGYEKPKEA